MRMRSEKKTRLIVVSLLFGSIFAHNLAMLPALHSAALPLRLLSLPLAVAALFVVLLRRRDDAQDALPARRRRSPALVAVAAFVAGAVAMSFLVETAPDGSDAATFALDLAEPAQGPAVSTVSVSTHTIDLDDPEQTEETVETAGEMAPKYTEITGRRADKLVEGAQAAGCTPRSGLVQAWEGAVVQRFDG